MPDRTYSVIDQAPPHHYGGAADTLNGADGGFEVLRLEDFTEEGTVHCSMGIPAGRAMQGGADHTTRGCICTSDEAMAAIVAHILGDPLVSIPVRGNHDPHNRRPRRRGDQHHPRRPTCRAGHGAFLNTPLT